MSVFSPLALTQALPFLPLAQGDIDYEVSRRDEPDLFDTVLLEPATKVILIKDGMVAVPHGQGAIADYANVHMRLAQLPGDYVAAELHAHPTALAMFLGSYGGKRDEHVVAVDVSRVMANGCCSPEWNRPLSRRSWTMRIVCCCSTTVHGAILACIPCPQASWRRVRIWSTHAGAKPKRRSASTSANSNIWDRSHGHSQPRS